MSIEAMPLPYEYEALEPHIGRETLRVHYEGHHRDYAEKLRDLLSDREDENRSLAELVRTARGSLYENAAQVWNHDFYWLSMTPGGGGEPEGALASLVREQFGTTDTLRKTIDETANAHFGSGWTWLTVDTKGRLAVGNTSDAGNPMRDGLVPLLTLDVWEHAYYLDRQNDRSGYVSAFLEELVDWRFASKNLADSILTGRVVSE